MLRLAFDFIIAWRETRTRPNAYLKRTIYFLCAGQRVHICDTLPDSFQRATIRLSFRGQAEIKVGSTFLLAELRINF